MPAARTVVVIQGHPDPDGRHFCHALADAYAQGAEAAGHSVRRIDVGRLDFPLLRNREEWTGGTPPEAIRQCQETIGAADHLVIVYPLWLGTLPALLKGFLEQVLRPGFAIEGPSPRGLWRRLLKGKSARIVVTMGMPALVYRLWFRAHSLKNLERNILKFCGIRPISESLVGTVEGRAAAREKWLARMRAYGRDAR